jgi:hypothetical protein
VTNDAGGGGGGDMVGSPLSRRSAK